MIIQYNKIIQVSISRSEFFFKTYTRMHNVIMIKFSCLAAIQDINTCINIEIFVALRRSWSSLYDFIAPMTNTSWKVQEGWLIIGQLSAYRHSTDFLTNTLTSSNESVRTVVDSFYYFFSPISAIWRFPLHYSKILFSD